MPKPSQRARRLAEIADEVTATLHLVEAGTMATEALDERHRAPLSELLRAIASRLSEAADDIQREMAEDILGEAA